MSLITYAKDVLAADSRTLFNTRGGISGGVFSATTDEKIKIFGNNNIAVAVCGPIPSPQEWITIGNILMKTVIRYELLDINIPVEITNEDIVAINAANRRFIIMSKKNTYYINVSIEDSLNNPGLYILPQLDNKNFIAFGTGATIAYTALNYDYDAYEAVQLALKLDPTVGGPVAKITRDQLNDFNSITGDNNARLELIKDEIKIKMDNITLIKQRIKDLS